MAIHDQVPASGWDFALRRTRRLRPLLRNVRIPVCRPPAEDVSVLQHLTATVHDTEQRVFRDMHKDSRFMADQIADAADECTTASQHDSAIDDVGGQFGRSALQGTFHRFHDHVQRLGNRFAQITGLEVDRAEDRTAMKPTSMASWSNASSGKADPIQS